MGLRQSMGRFGASSNDVMTDYVLTQTQCISCTVWIGFIMLIIANIIAIIMFITIKYYNHQILITRRQQNPITTTITNITHSTSLLSATPNMPQTPNTMRSVQHNQEISLSTHDHSQSGHSHHSSTIPINYGTVSSSSYRKRSSFRLRDIHDFNSLYWLLNICCSLMYSCTVSWNNIAQNQLENDFNLKYVTTDQLLTIFFVITGICGPIVGLVADKIGRKCQLIIFCGGLLLLGHSLIYCFDKIHGLNPIWIVIVLGIGFSIFPAAIFPGIAIIVRKKTYGTAYGLVTATFNTTLTVAPIIIAILTTPNYKHVEIFFMMMASLSIIIGLLLMFYDNKYGSKLSISPIKWKKKRIMDISHS